MQWCQKKGMSVFLQQISNLKIILQAVALKTIVCKHKCRPSYPPPPKADFTIGGNEQIFINCIAVQYLYKRTVF